MCQSRPAGGGVRVQRFLKDPYHKDQFTYDERSDSFMCPQGQTLAFSVYSMRGPVATVPGFRRRLSGCPAFRVCTKAKEIGRSLAIVAVLRRHRAWMSTSAAKEVYRLRKQLVEPVFGIIKEQQGARRFLAARPRNSVAAEWIVPQLSTRTLWPASRASATPRAESPPRFLITTAPVIANPSPPSTGKSRSVLIPTAPTCYLITFGTGSIPLGPLVETRTSRPVYTRLAWPVWRGAAIRQYDHLRLLPPNRPHHERGTSVPMSSCPRTRVPRGGRWGGVSPVPQG